MSEWQPIETAPKDGTYILGYRPSKLDYDSKIAVVSWTAETWAVRPTRDLRLSHMPTHWMPLPPAPSTTLNIGEPKS